MESMGKWGNVKMEQWEKWNKGVEAKLNLKQEQVQGSEPGAVYSKHAQMVEMITTNESCRQ